MARCTIPHLFGFDKWYQKRFGDLCEAHDRSYMLRLGSKWKADAALFKGIWGRGYRALAVGTWLFCATIGWWYWYD